MFITFEGCDATGKTFFAERLREYFRHHNIPCILTREPGGCDKAEAIRKLLMSMNDSCCETQLFLILAARVEHIKTIIKPALKRRDVVICDRFHDSTIVYQGYGYRVFSPERIMEFNSSACFGVKPDITFLLQADDEVRKERLNKRESRDYFEKIGSVYDERIKNGYLEIAKNNPERVKIINANLSPELVMRQIKETLKRFSFNIGRIDKSILDNEELKKIQIERKNAGGLPPFDGKCTVNESNIENKPEDSVKDKSRSKRRKKILLTENSVLEKNTVSSTIPKIRSSGRKIPFRVSS